MAKYDVFRVRGVGLLVDVQADHLRLLDTRVVLSVVPSDEVTVAIPDLHPMVEVEGRRCFVLADRVATIARSRLGGPAVANLTPFQDDITRALDILLTGF